MSSFDDEVPASADWIEWTPPARAATAFGGFVGRRFRFRRQRSRTTSSRRKARTHPTMIPIIAAVDSFFLDLVLGCGDGVKQEGRGLPQRARFPAKADDGNLERVSGMDPLRALLETLNEVMEPVTSMLGRAPEKSLS
ncbi:hypothetical protein MLD38_006620 [Melastoma candidum]|uniref:Uncharacterized protein n=1 Tax=Melastoma candidum TaxID=119954 RepID=A0ACB9RN71_9MYRT|nr:hypothetical protein MLD38_006620 [Melastoma candidum]